MSTGAGEAKRARRRAQSDIARQRRLEQQRLAESDDEIARRKLRFSRGGKRSLIRNPAGERGVSNLGGVV